MNPIERHPFEPFLPSNAKVLFLGSFPPQQKRWSMDFYYPNFINDFWRIVGLIFFKDKEHFILEGQKQFDKDAIVAFCSDRGIAMFDTASSVRRLKDNASDKFLEVVEPTDIESLVSRLPLCRAIVATGQKATDVIVGTYRCDEPLVGGCVPINIGSRDLLFYRMPSSSRAYPLSLDKKAVAYSILFSDLGMI